MRFPQGRLPILSLVSTRVGMEFGWTPGYELRPSEMWNRRIPLLFRPKITPIILEVQPKPQHGWQQDPGAFPKIRKKLRFSHHLYPADKPFPRVPRLEKAWNLTRMMETPPPGWTLYGVTLPANLELQRVVRRPSARLQRAQGQRQPGEVGPRALPGQPPFLYCNHLRRPQGRLQDLYLVSTRGSAWLEWTQD